MESEDNYEIETAEQFWEKLVATVSQPCETDEAIDDALRSYLALTTGYPAYIETNNDLRRCAYKLYSSLLFTQHADYIRTQLVHCFLQDDELDVLHITSTFLLADALEHESTFELLNNEGGFRRMVELIGTPKKEGEEGLHRLLMELMYEMARIQRITDDDLLSVDDNFMRCLFNIIEEVSGDVTDPYHYPVIRVLLVLNEQYMVAAHSPSVTQTKTIPLTNKVIKVLSSHGNKYKTFGENIILLLNREDETSLQLLTLKLLYLLFTTPSTCEYFYTNDLHVLVDILVRNLLDLPEEAMALRHTYLRVLHPLLENTQLQHPPHYKREEVRKLLSVMAGDRIDDGDDSVVRFFEDVDDTTKRLVRRCQTVGWLGGPTLNIPQAESPTDVGPSIIVSPESPSKTSKAPPALPAPRKLKKRGSSKGSDIMQGVYLNPQLEARQSSLSMMEMASQKEKPGIKTPSRNPSLKHGLRGLVMQKKERPPPPKTRRSGWRRDRTTELEVAESANTVADSAGDTSLDENTQDSTGEDLRITRTKSAETKQADIKDKKPPPAPKTRRWRGKRAKEEDEGGGSVVIRPKEPGKFSANLPSINTPNTDQPIEQSPFSPPIEKTLSPEHGTEINPLSSKQISSVSAALGQAQLQAIQNIEDTFEKAHIDVSHNHKDHHQNVSGVHSAEDRERNNSPILSRTVLAPPGQAPIRGVPGPKMELERSPFLTENESEEVIPTVSSLGIEDKIVEEGEVEEESEDEWND